MLRRLGLCALLGVFSGHWAVAQNNPVFPVLDGETLLGNKTKFPDSKSGSVARMIIGFTKDSQSATTRCADALEKPFQNSVYSLSVIQGVPFFVKGLVKSKIKESVPEPRRGRYLLLEDGRDELESLAEWSKLHPDDAYILCTRSRADGQFEVVLKTHAACTDKDLPSLLETMKKVCN